MSDVGIDIGIAVGQALSFIHRFPEVERVRAAITTTKLSPRSGPSGGWA